MHIPSLMREIVLAVVSVLTATKAPQKRIFLFSTPLVNNFMCFLSHYVLFAPIVCICKETKVELLNKVPGVESMCFSCMASHGGYFLNYCL